MKPLAPPSILRADDHRTMRWKNGLGRTTEIAVFAPDARPISYVTKAQADLLLIELSPISN